MRATKVADLTGNEVFNVEVRRSSEIIKDEKLTSVCFPQPSVAIFGLPPWRTFPQFPSTDKGSTRIKFQDAADARPPTWP